MAHSLTSLFRGWRAALLLVAAAFATPGRATAECGDHVVILTAPLGEHRPATAGSHTDAPPRPVKVPCHGPDCSAPPAPADTLWTVPSAKDPRESNAAALAAAVGHAATHSVEWSIPGPDCTPTSRPFAPFHPPKSS
jgi:hypothetical protein